MDGTMWVLAVMGAVILIAAGSYVAGLIRRRVERRRRNGRVRAAMSANALQRRETVRRAQPIGTV